MNFLGKIKNNFIILFVVFLWLCVWATYNTDIFRIFYPGFPHNIFDFIHGVRSILPFFALILAFFILIKNKKLNMGLFKGPLGMLLLYSIIGVIASVLSKEPLVSFYWGVLYLSAIIILLAVSSSPEYAEKEFAIARANWIIAGVIAIGLVLVLLSKPGLFSLSTITEFLSGARPYEGIGGIGGGKTLLDMPGTRATGLGRFAGVAAIVLFANIWRPRYKTKIIFASLFAVFFSILIFSRARTAVIAFFIAALVLLWLKSKLKSSFVFISGSVFLLLLSFNFYQFSLAYLQGENLLIENHQVASNINNSSNSQVALNIPANEPSDNSSPGNYPNNTLNNAENNTENSTDIVKNILDDKATTTLSGRTSGVWTDAWSLFLKSPFLGFGFQADRIFLQGRHTHNSFLQALVQSGIIGTLFFILAFVLSCIISIRLFKIYPENIFLIEAIGILVFFIVRSITESSAYFGADFLFLAPVFAYLQFFPKEEKKIQQMDFCQNKIDLIKTSAVEEKINYWIQNEPQKLHWIVATGMHGIVEASRHEDFKSILASADLFVPDGISLVWLGRLKGFDVKKRVSGVDLMQEFFKVSAEKGYKNYFYGDTEDTLKKLTEKFPSVKADFYSPPFRNLTEEEDEKIIEKINLAKPDILWVGLGLPKQEKWIFEHRERLNVPVAIGVGAAFKFLSGKIRRAPKWIGESGFEWLWRLFCEPKKTWKRVFFDIPYFLWLVFLELTGLKRYK